MVWYDMMLNPLVIFGIKHGLRNAHLQFVFPNISKLNATLFSNVIGNSLTQRVTIHRPKFLATAEELSEFPVYI